MKYLKGHYIDTDDKEAVSAELIEKVQAIDQPYLSGPVSMRDFGLLKRLGLVVQNQG